MELLFASSVRADCAEWRRTVIDGRQDWLPLGFVDHVIDQDVEFIFHVDEDRFVGNRSEVLHLIKKMQENRNIVAAGIPDGGQGGCATSLLDQSHVTS